MLAFAEKVIQSRGEEKLDRVLGIVQNIDNRDRHHSRTATRTAQETRQAPWPTETELQRIMRQSLLQILPCLNIPIDADALNDKPGPKDLQIRVTIRDKQIQEVLHGMGRQPGAIWIYINNIIC